MNFSPAKQQIIEDAQKAGFTVNHGNSSVDIFKGHFDRWKNLNVTKGLRIYEGGSAYDMTVDSLDAAKCLRSHADMREILGIN